MLLTLFTHMQPIKKQAVAKRLQNRYFLSSIRNVVPLPTSLLRT